MLVLPWPLLRQLITYAYQQHPIEACGVLAARPDDRLVRQLYPMTNADRSARSFQFDIGQQLAIWREMEDRVLVPVAIYHSHTSTAPRPSRIDIERSTAVPDTDQLLISTADPDRWRLRLWRIRQRCAHPVAVVLYRGDQATRIRYQLQGRSPG